MGVALRTFLVEAAWNYKGMQNLGFCSAIMPALKRVYSGQALIEAAKRHLSVFNTNPVFSGFIVGAIAEMERSSAAKGRPNEQLAEGMKSRLGGAFGAIGDELLWASARPLLACLAVLMFLMGNDWAFLFMVGLFASLSIWIRLVGVSRGACGGEAVREFLQRFNPGHLSLIMKRGTCVLLGAVLGVILCGGNAGILGEIPPLVGVLIVAPVAVVAFIIRAKNVPAQGIAAALCGISILCAFLIR